MKKWASVARLRSEAPTTTRRLSTTKTDLVRVVRATGVAKSLAELRVGEIVAEGKHGVVVGTHRQVLQRRRLAAAAAAAAAVLLLAAARVAADHIGRLFEGVCALGGCLVRLQAICGHIRQRKLSTTQVRKRPSKNTSRIKQDELRCSSAHGGQI